MLRKFLGAGFVAAVIVSLAAADEFTALIRKVDNGKVTFAKMKKGEKGEKKRFELEAEETLPAAANVKVSTGKFNREEKKFEAGEALEGGLQNPSFKDTGEKGIPARIVTDGGKITEIRVINFQKKKDQ